MACHFDRLSDCILLTLLKKLDGTSLYQLSQVNSRFQRLALEPCLWKRIDGRSAPNNEEKINYILDRVHESTDMLLLRGIVAFGPVVDLMGLNIFSNLTILALENQLFHENCGIKITDFPKSVEEISFKNSIFEESSEFFRKGFEAMENLKVLILDGCSRVSCSVIMSISKYPNLEIFSCYKCPIENSVAYFSIAVSSGFKKIKVFDVRLSGLGNTFLSSMLKKSNILMLYFQNKDTSYEIDFRNRAKELVSKNLPIPRVRFQSFAITGNEENLVTDFGTLEFSRTSANYEEYKIPKSVLYKYPYPPCTCGFKDKVEELKMKAEETEPTKTMAFYRGDERKLIDIIEEYSDDDSTVKEENVEGYSEKSSNNAGNSSTETGQSSDNRGDSNRDPSQSTSTSSSSDINSHLDASNRTSLLPSRTCTEIIYSVFSKKKKTKNKSVGTDSTNQPDPNVQNDEKMDTGPVPEPCHPQDQSTESNVEQKADQPSDGVVSDADNTKEPNKSEESNEKDVENKPNTSAIVDTTSSTENLSKNDENCSRKATNDTVTATVNNQQDLPSTSGLSLPMRKRKLGYVNTQDGKRFKRSLAVDVASSSSDEEDGKRVELDPDFSKNIPCSLGSSDHAHHHHDHDHGDHMHNTRHSDGQILYISRGNASSKRISNAVTTYLNDRSRRIAESNQGSSNEPSSSGARRGDVALVECRAGSNAQPARTQVYPCACGNHSVIVVTADETDDGDVVLGPPLNPPENHFHPRHCEQRINLNSRQSLRVINRNANINARPQIELVEIKKDKSLKCALKELSFRGYYRITDLTLKNVEHLELDLLDVTYTKCSKKGILEFLTTNPNCRVLHKDFCVCKPLMDF